MTFSKQVTLDQGATAEINTTASTDLLAFTGGISSTPLTTTAATLGLDGPGTTTIQGDVSFGMTLVYGANLTGTTGTLMVGANLGGALGNLIGGSDQLFVQGGTVKLAGINGTGGIDMQTGTLVAGSADSYSGQITLEQSAIGKTGPIVSIGDSASLGSGLLRVKGPALLAGNVPTIDASHATAGVTLANTLFMTTSSIVNITGSVTFTNAVSISEDTTAEINTISNGDKLNLNGGISNAAIAGSILGLDGPGTTTIGGTIGAKLTVQYGTSLTGSTGTLVLAANIGGIVGEVITTSSVVIQGGDAKLNGVSGSNGIELQGGTLEAGSASSFHGNITLDQGNGTLTTPKIVINSDTSLGDGQLIVTGPTKAAANVPLLDASGASSAVTLANALILQDGATLNILGSITFAEAASATGVAAAVNTTSSSDVVIFQDGITTSLTAVPSLTLDGPGTFGISGTLSNPVTVVFGPVAAGTTGTLVLGCNLGGLLGLTNPRPSLVTLKGGRLAFQGLSGNSGIDIQGGTLVAQSGAPSYTGTITLENGGTINVTETTDTVALGTGTLRLLGGTLQNGATTTAILANNVSVEGTVDVASLAARLKFSGTLNLTVSGELDAHGSVAVIGSITGPGIIKLDGSDFDVSGSNSGYTGNITWDSGTIEVTSNSALGLGKVLVAAVGKVILQAVNSIGDPVLDNPFVVSAGTLVLEGQFTFPNGVTVDAGAILEIEGADSQIIVSGPLAGGGSVLIDAGTFSATGDQSGFTGTVTDQSGKFVPTLTVTDAGGVANGSPYPATYTLTGNGTPPGTELDGVGATLTYYVGDKVAGQGSTTAPSAAGTYTVVASFPGTANYATVQSDPATFVITPAPAKTNPTLSVADVGGVFNGSPFAATITLIGTSGTPTATLDGIAPTVTYYVGSTATGNGSANAPSAVGTYTVIALFPGSVNYAAAQSNPVTFVITPAPQSSGPAIVAPTSVSLAENSSIVFSKSNHNAISVADGKSNAGSIEQLTLVATHGTIKLMSTAGLKFIKSSNNSSSITIQGTLTSLNKALDGLTYTPSRSFAGSAALHISISELGGEHLSASTTVAMNIVAPPRPMPTVKLVVLQPVAVRGQTVTIGMNTSEGNGDSFKEHVTYHVSFGDGTSTTFVGPFDASGNARLQIHRNVHCYCDRH